MIYLQPRFDGAVHVDEAGDQCVSDSVSGSGKLVHETRVEVVLVVPGEPLGQGLDADSRLSLVPCTSVEISSGLCGSHFLFC